MLELRGATCTFGVAAIMHLIDDQALNSHPLSNPEVLDIMTRAMIEETSSVALEIAFVRNPRLKSWACDGGRTKFD